MDLNVGCQYLVEPNASSSSRERNRTVQQGGRPHLINLEGATERRVIDEGTDGRENLNKPILYNMEKGYKDLNPPNVDGKGLNILGRMPDRRFRGTDKIEDLQDERRRHIERQRYSPSIYPLGGSLNNHSESGYVHGEQLKNRYSGNQFDNLDYSGDSRTELLRKIDELRDQLNRSSMADSPHPLGNLHYHRYKGLEDWIPTSSSGEDRPYMQYPYPDHPPTPTSYMNPYAAESLEYRNMNATGGSHFNRADINADNSMERNSRYLKNLKNDHHYNALDNGFSDRQTLKNRPFVQHLFPDQNPAPSSFTNHYGEPSAHIYMHPTDRWPEDIGHRPIGKNPDHLRIVHDGHYRASEDSFSVTSSGKNRPTPQYPFPDRHPAPASYINRFREPSAYVSMHVAASSHNFHSPHNIRSRVQVVGDPEKRFADIPHNALTTVSYHYENPGSLALLNYDTKATSMPQVQSENLQFHARWASEVDSELTSRISHQHPKLQPITGSQHCHPLGHGAPFIACKNCFELLQVPIRAMVKSGMQKKVQCGSCSSMIVMDMLNKNLFVSILEENKESIPVAENDSIKLIEGNSQAQGHTNRATLTLSSEDNDHSRSGFQAMDRESLPRMENQQVFAESIGTKSIHTTTSDTAKEVSAHDPVAGSRIISSQGHANRATLTFSSEDFDHSGYEFQSMDREAIPRISNKQVFSESIGKKSVQATSSYTAKEVATHDPVAASLRSCSPTESSMEGKPAPPPTGSSLQEYFEYSNKYHRGHPLEKGSRSSDQKTLTPNISASRKNFTADLSEATEMEISSNGFGNTESSLDSGVTRKSGGQIRVNKAAEAFLAGNGTDRFRDSENSNLQDEQAEDNVTINGHLIPNRLIKRAEKVAGRIQPGNYWYDFRAGFWGVIGGHCLGIIPPSIEEFKYQMPENCAGGNTSVYVNGRELHEKDLNLLINRGLPNDKNRYYNIKISGQVLDEMTGEKLASLGNLAPTVSRVKHGFGMKAPRQQHGP